MPHRIVEYLLPRTVSLSKLHKEIKSQFPYHSESSTRVERHYQDSFDCRLYKSGYEYFIEIYPDQINLFLYSTNKPDTVHILATHQIPVVAHDFISVIFQKIMLPTLDVRALMPHILLHIKRRWMTLINEENKAFVQLHLDDVEIVNPKCKPDSLGSYLRVLPVKGYEQAAVAVTDFIKHKFNLNPSDETLLTRILNKTKTDYCPLMRFPHHDLQPEMRTDEAVKAILLSELEIMELNENGLIRDIDSEFLHDYRVAIRRTRSVLKQIKGVFHKRITDRYNAAFSRLGKLTGPLRDIHVYLLKFDAYQQQLPDEIKPHLEPFRAFLLKHKNLEHDKLVHELTTKRYFNFKSNWRKFLEQPLPGTVHLPNATRLVKQVSDVAIWNAYRKVVSYGKKIGDGSPDEKLHRMRINCKKLRYLLEFFTDLYPQKKLASVIKKLKKLQNMLGDFQDSSVQVIALRQFESQMKEEGALTEQTLEAMEYLVTCINKMKKELRMQYVECYADLSSAKTEIKFSELFNSEYKAS